MSTRTPSSSAKLLSSHVVPSVDYEYGFIRPQRQNLAFPFIEFNEIPVGIPAILPIVQRRPHLLYPNQVVCSRQSPQYCPCWSALYSWPISSELADLMFQGRAPCIPLPSWPALPHRPLSIHCSAPGMLVIPPHPHYPKEIVALQLHTDLQFLMFVPHAACNSIKTLQRGSESCWFPSSYFKGLLSRQADHLPKIFSPHFVR